MAKEKVAPLSLDDVEPRRLYPLKDAAAYCPSPRGGVMTPRALHYAVRRGDLKAHQVRGFWFVWGGDLLEWLQMESLPVFYGRSAAQRQQAHERAMERLRAMGLKV